MKGRDEGSNKTDALSLMMPKEFVKQRLWCAEKLCLRPNGVSRNLQDLVFGAMNSFGQSGWGLTADEFLNPRERWRISLFSPRRPGKCVIE